MVELPKVTLNTDLREGYCFGCGQNNPIGLKLAFSRYGEGVRAEYNPGPYFQGWPGLLHGGITGALLDEAMSHAAHATGHTCLTAAMTIRLRQPIPVNATLVVTANITRQRKKVIETAGAITLPDGTVVAEGSAKQFIVENAPPVTAFVREEPDHV